MEELRSDGRIGNRSSVDETRSNGEEDETTVEPDQGNGGHQHPHDEELSLIYGQ